MRPADVVRDNPRLAANVGDVLEGLSPVLADQPNLRIHWVEEYARAEVAGESNRAGIVAVAAGGLVLMWRHGLMYRKRTWRWIPRSDIDGWEWTGDRLVGSAPGSSGPAVVVEFRPESAEAEAFGERFRLIAPWGRG
ncbi:MAG: hypothetical protein R2715_06520 [Ilumatobacteraceae bacterium]